MSGCFISLRSVHGHFIPTISEIFARGGSSSCKQYAAICGVARYHVRLKRSVDAPQPAQFNWRLVIHRTARGEFQNGRPKSYIARGSCCPHMKTGSSSTSAETALRPIFDAFSSASQSARVHSMPDQERALLWLYSGHRARSPTRSPR